MTLRRFGRWAPLCAASATLIVACGGDDSPAPVATTTTPPATTTPVTTSANAPAACTALGTLATTEYAVTGVTGTFVAASASAPFAVPSSTATITTPFCRVTGTAKSNANSAIAFELWLPDPANWNGKFAGTASGGSAGSISYGTVAAHYALNYASIGHDTGHTSTGFSQTWAYDTVTHALKMDQIVDWASRSQHVVTVVGKQLTTAFYGTAASRAYYNGCSASGHAGMMEAQRYPEDYDGIVAGAHTSDWTTNMASQAWVAAQQWGNRAVGGISKDQYVAVGKAILAQCDGKAGIDSVVDGVLDDPRKCAFDPAILQCTGASTDAPTCLADLQVKSLRAMYQGYTTASGDRIAYPYSPDATTGAYWPNNTTTPTNPQGSWADYFRYPFAENPNYDFSLLDFNVTPLAAREKLRPIYDAYQTDLTAFRRHGGKLLMYHGWADSLISPFLTLDYYAAMQSSMGATTVQDFTRLFMVPGIDHCGGGTGTGNFSLMQALANWVERGVAPDATGAADTVIATGSDGRTRPLCPYPKLARYLGSGDVKAAASFSCQNP